jgi:transcriptional antiterminator Rof (Rho-off)
VKQAAALQVKARDTHLVKAQETHLVKAQETHLVIAQDTNQVKALTLYKVAQENHVVKRAYTI